MKTEREIKAELRRIARVFRSQLRADLRAAMFVSISRDRRKHVDLE